MSHLVHIGALHDVALHRTDVTVAGVGQLRRLPGLTRLAMWPVLPADAAQLRQILPNCQIETAKIEP